jgi:hypothetical protein
MSGSKFGRLKWGGAFAAVFAIAVLVTLLVVPRSVIYVNSQQNLGHVGTANVAIQHANDTTIYHVGWLPGVWYNETSHNVFTSFGAQWLKNSLAWRNDTSATLSVIVMGNFSGTPAITNTALTTEDTTVCTRTNGTIANANVSSYTSAKTWSSVASPTTLNATSLNLSAAASTADACAIALITQAALAAGDSLTTTWTVYDNPG